MGIPASIGLVRNKTASEKAFGEDVPKNIVFLEADITDVNALKVGAREPSNAIAGIVLPDAC